MHWKSGHSPFPFLLPPQIKKPLALWSFSKSHSSWDTFGSSHQSWEPGQVPGRWHELLAELAPGRALPEDQPTVCSLTRALSVSESLLLPAPYQDSLIAILSSAINLFFINERINRRDNLISDLLKTKLGILNKVYKVLWETFLPIIMTAARVIQSKLLLKNCIPQFSCFWRSPAPPD